LGKRGIEWHFSLSVRAALWRFMGTPHSVHKICTTHHFRRPDSVQRNSAVCLSRGSNANEWTPLEYVPVDPQDPILLTPNHFLLLEANSNESLDVIDLSEKPSTKGWRAAKDLITHFWRRWIREIVPKLNYRSKWTAPNRNIAVNDFVFIFIQPLSDVSGNSAAYKKSFPISTAPFSPHPSQFGPEKGQKQNF
jgi:hypothetical protein